MSHTPFSMVYGLWSTDQLSIGILLVITLSNIHSYGGNTSKLWTNQDPGRDP